MTLLRTRWKLTLDIPGLLFWCLIGLIFPVGAGTIGVVSCLKCLLFLFVSVCLGEILLGSLAFIQRIPVWLRTGFSMVTGSYLLFLLFALTHAAGLLYVLGVLMAILLFITGKFSWSFDRIGLAAILPICLLLFYTTDVHLATSPVFVDVDGDYFYYNVLVISLSKTLSIFDAIVHTGIPINYQSLTYFSPAALTYSTGIPAHIALHGIYSPIVKVLSLSMVSASVVYLCRYLGKKEFNWKYYMGASLALLLIAPLHPLYLAKGDVKNFIFLGEGYLLPIGVMGFAMAILLFGVLNFFTFSDGKKSYAEIGIFVLFLSSIVAIKTALFFPLIAFYGLYSLFRWMKDGKDRNIVYVFLSLIGGAIFMWVFFGASGGMIKNGLTLHEGYFPVIFSEALQRFHRAPTTLYLLLFFVFMFFLWLGLKTLLFAGIFVGKKPFVADAGPVILAALGCLIVSILPGCFIKVSMVDETGKLLQNDTFDMGQFMRAALFISTTVGAMALLLLWGTGAGTKRRRAFQAVVIVWFGLALASFIKLIREPIQPSGTDAVWENQVVDDFQNVHPRLMGMLSDGRYSGEFLVTKEVYPWWTCARRGYSGGYVCTLKSNYRNKLIEQLLADSLSKGARIAVVRKMEAEGVDALVATPANESSFEKLTADSVLTRPSGSKWIYKLVSEP